MIDKGRIISFALLRLGNVNDYNDDRSNTYEACDKILPSILESICSDTSLNFAVSKAKLTQYEEAEDETGEYKFNLPADFLGISKRAKLKRSVSSEIIPVSVEMGYASSSITRNSTRLQGEFIYSYSPEITLYYVKKIPLSEFPTYMFDYITWKLATEMALLYPSFTERLGYCETKAKEALYEVQKLEGFGVAYE